MCPHVQMIQVYNRHFQIQKLFKCSLKPLLMPLYWSYISTAIMNFMHWGEMIEDRVDERGEVALLTRNIVIRGEMMPECPDANENCGDYDYDTFGGHVKVLTSTKYILKRNLKPQSQDTQNMQVLHCIPWNK